MKKLALILLLTPILAFAQAARYDLPAVTTTPGQVPSGSLPPLLAVTNATVSVCGYPAVLVAGMCTNTIITYTDSTLTTACPSTAPLTAPGTNVCVPTTGLQGAFGFWYNTGAQTHMTYTVRAKWGTFGPYDIDPGGAGGGGTTPTGTGFIHVTSGVQDGAAANPSFSQVTGNLAANQGPTGITGLLKISAGVISQAVAGTDYQAPLTLTTTGTSGAATLIGNTLNIPQYSAGSGGTAVEVNGGSALGTANFANNSGAGEIDFTNPSGSTVNATLHNTSTAVNGQTCALGSTCTVTVPISSGVSGLGTNVATFLATPNSADLAAALTDETGNGAAMFAGSPAMTGVPTAPTAAPGTNTTQVATTAYVLANAGNLPTLPTVGTVPYNLTSTPSGGVGGAATWSLPGIPGRTVTGTSDTIALTDRSNVIVYNSASAVAVTLTSAATLGNNFSFGIWNENAGAVTFTPGAGTINGASTLVVNEGENCTINSIDNTNYIARCSSGQLSGDATLALTRTALGLQFGIALNHANTWTANQTVTGHIIFSGHDVAIPLACADSSGSGTAQSCTTSPSFTPVAGDHIIYTTTTANTGTGLTLNVNGLGAKSVSKWAGSSTTLAANDVLAGKQVLATYDGTTWELSTIGNAPSGGGGGSPCTTTPNSLQFDSSGSFGCAHITDNGTTLGATLPINSTSSVSTGTAPTIPGSPTAAIWAGGTGSCSAGVTAVGILCPNSADNTMQYTVNAGTVNRAPQMQEISAAYSNSTTGATNIVGLAFSVAATSQPYLLHCHGRYQAASGGGLVLTLTGPSTPVLVGYDMRSTTTLSGGAPTDFRAAATLTTTYPTAIGGPVVTVSTDMPWDFDVSFINGSNPGTLQLQAQSSTAVALTIEAGAACTLQ